MTKRRSPTRRARPAARPKTGASRSVRRTRRRKSPGRIWAFLAKIPRGIKRLVLQSLVAVSVLSASFPAITDSVGTWVGDKVDMQRLQSLLAVPVLGSLIERADLGGGGSVSDGGAHTRSKSSNSRAPRKDRVRNPFV